MALFQFMTDGTLLRPLNLTNLVLQNSYIVIMALGMLLVIVAGHIDLSVGSVCGFVGALAAVLMVEYDWDYVPTFVVCLVAGGLDRRGAGLVRRLLQDPVLHRHAGRHAGVQGPDAGAAGGPVGRPVPRDLPEAELGLPARSAGRREPAHAPRCCSARWPPRRWSSSSCAAAPGRRRTAWRPSPSPSSCGKNLFFAAAILLLSYLLATYKGLPNVLVVMSVLIVAYDFVTNRTTVGRRIYARRRQREGGAAVGHQDPAADLPDLRQHGRAGGAGRPGVRGPAEHRDAESRPGLRARRDRRLLHRRRLGLGRRRPGDRAR